MLLGNWYRKMIKLKELLNESINEALPFSSSEAQKHVDGDIVKMSKFLGKAFILANPNLFLTSSWYLKLSS